jgi:hypothetical protein
LRMRGSLARVRSFGPLCSAHACRLRHAISVSGAEIASVLNTLFSSLPALATAAIAIYTLMRDERMQRERRAGEAGRIALDHALRRRFELVDRLSQGVGRYEGLLQYRDQVAVDLPPDRELTSEVIAKLDALQGGYEAWGAYRAAAHELGDPELENECIWLGNDLAFLLLRRPPGEFDENARAQLAQTRLDAIWPKLRGLRKELERELSS